MRKALTPELKKSSEFSMDVSEQEPQNSDVRFGSSGAPQLGGQPVGETGQVRCHQWSVTLAMSGQFAGNTHLRRTNVHNLVPAMVVHRLLTQGKTRPDDKATYHLISKGIMLKGEIFPAWPPGRNTKR